jgi:hypothetical protein
MENVATEFGTYAKFYSLEEAEALLLLLASNNIPFKVDREENNAGRIILGGMDPMITVSIPPEEFGEVNQLVEGSIDGIV